ncbi:NADPH-dependent FMN reductase [Enemella sp. A6]|uniref:NADPH-dependent FMN reductase n=1 Tax=Enemella sp. A6 TaxID=3440152 RepID=UPI003EBC0090
MIRIAIIVGSTRPNALGAKVGAWVLEQAQGRDDAEYELISVADQQLPLLDEPLPAGSGVYSQPHTKAWAAIIDAFDGFIFVTPEYNHSVPGAFKNAFDFLYGEWRDKAVGFVSYGAAGGVRAAEHWRAIVANAHMWDVRGQVTAFLTDDFTDGEFTPRDFQFGAMGELLTEVVTTADRAKRTRN